MDGRNRGAGLPRVYIALAFTALGGVGIAWSLVAPVSTLPYRREAVRREAMAPYTTGRVAHMTEPLQRLPTDILFGFQVAMFAAEFPTAPSPGASIAPQVSASVRSSSFEQMLATAKIKRAQALETVKRAMEQHQEEDPARAAAIDVAALRRGLLAADRGGLHRQALYSARRASPLASDLEERSRAAEFLVMLECEAGHHREELRQAHRLAAIRCRDRRSLMVLLRAASCNGSESLARRICGELGSPRK